MDDAEFQCPDGRVRLIRTGPAPDCRVISIAKVYPRDVAAHQAAEPGSVALLAAEAEQLDGSFDWGYQNEKLVKLPPIVPAISALVAEGRHRVDQDAESARLPWLTWGSGQALE